MAQDLARLVGCERAVLAPSTLHLYWDLFDVLARDRVAIYADAGTYPIARWGIERAAAKGVPTSTFPTHDPAALESLLVRDERARRRPIVVTDGLCTATGRIAPLPDYLKLIRERNGYLVIDDTQALGILGKMPARDAPYGRGGAGTPAWNGVEGPEVIIGSSLAKGFGAPLAVLAGNAKLMAKFEELSATRVHSSPPSLADISAAQRALAANETRGDSLRSHLAKLVRHFRESLGQIGLSASGGLFPVQTLKAIPGVDPEPLYRRLLSLGVRAGFALGATRAWRRPQFPRHPLPHSVGHQPLHGRIGAIMRVRPPRTRQISLRVEQSGFRRPCLTPPTKHQWEVNHERRTQLRGHVV